jgi:hypothetical protein
MSHSTVVFSTATGQDAPAIDADVVVEHHRPTNLRVTDPRYGLKTAARTAAEKKARQEAREVFLAQRRKALEHQRDQVQARLDGLQKEIRKVIAKLEAGKIQGETAVNDAFERLQRMGGTEAKLISDVTRLNNKIGG